jgi:hypothetical protein
MKEFLVGLVIFLGISTLFRFGVYRINKKIPENRLWKVLNRKYFIDK